MATSGHWLNSSSNSKADMYELSDALATHYLSPVVSSRFVSSYVRTAMLYSATHITRHFYQSPVSQSLNELRLTPRSLPGSNGPGD